MFEIWSCLCNPTSHEYVHNSPHLSALLSGPGGAPQDESQGMDDCLSPEAEQWDRGESFTALGMLAVVTERPRTFDRNT